jgi:Spy/CpxP family protein refolding chaperone
MNRIAMTALTVLLLAGCNTTIAASVTTPTASAAPLIFGPTGGGGQQMGMPGGGGLDQVLAGLGLTADQQAKIQALNPQPAGQPPAGSNLTTLLTADALDVTALRAAIAAQPLGGPDRSAYYQGVYDVLTAAQRTALATALKAAPAQGGPGGQPQGMPSGMQPPPGGSLNTSGLTLTTAQQAALDAFQAKLAGTMGGPTSNATVATYFETGDATKPTAGFPVDELVALAQALTAAQRKQVFANGLGGPAPFAS